MIKRFAYIVLLLLFASCLSFANTIKNKSYVINFSYHNPHKEMLIDTTAARKKQQQEDEKKKDDEKKKIKEIAKAKHQTKPEKVDDKAEQKPKPKRERRPEGMERPPEIPRRN